MPPRGDTPITSTKNHPIVGTWEVILNLGDQTINAMYVYHEDGTLTTVLPTSGGGAAIWRPTGERTFEGKGQGPIAAEDGSFAGWYKAGGTGEVLADDTYVGEGWGQAPDGERVTASLTGTRLAFTD